ncbi:MAG: MFS transporter [Solirubrobacteraceae bacterium]
MLVIASLAAFMAFLDTTIVNIAFPALQRAFPGEPTASISWVLNAYNIVFAALLIPAGQLADRHSRRDLFLFGLALFTLASGCCAIAPSLSALVACRTIQAVGAAILIPTGMALLLPAFSPGEQIRAIALLAAVSGVAFAAGPSIGGILIHTVGWRGIFLINVPIGLLTLPLAHRFIAAGQRPACSSRLPDIAGALLTLFGVGLLALAIVQGNAWGWSDTRIVASFVAGGCLIATAIWRATRHPVPAIELDLFKARRFTVANIAVFAFAIGLAAKLLCDVLFMTSVWRYSELKTGLAVSASPLVTAAVASTAARIAMRVGSRLAAAIGGALYATGCLWYVTHMGAHPHYLDAYLPGTAFTGIGIALILPTLTSAAMLAVPSPRLAAGAGINSMIRQLGAVLGVALFIAIVGSPTPATALAAFHHGWTLAAIASGIAALATVALHTGALDGEPRGLRQSRSDATNGDGDVLDSGFGDDLTPVLLRRPEDDRPIEHAGQATDVSR